MNLFEKIKEAKQRGRPLFWDGAMGTQLIARGLAGRAPEAWNLEKPELLREIHADYVAAGAEVIQTNTFGANRLKLKSAGLEDQLQPINSSAARAACEAAAGKALVAGDLGPTGEMMTPMGNLEPDQTEGVYREQGSILAEAGVDLFSIETMFALEEAQAAVRGLKSAAPKLAVVCSMTFKRTARGFFTMMGVSPERAVKGMLEAGADVVGANCSIGPKDMVELVKVLRPLTDRPLLAQANAGEPTLEAGREIYEVAAEDFAAFARPMFEAGADALGACCGSSPEFIRRMREKF